MRHSAAFERLPRCPAIHRTPPFPQALELRWRQLLRQGRAVVAVGDFNITAAPVSSFNSCC